MSYIKKIDDASHFPSTVEQIRPINEIAVLHLNFNLLHKCFKVYKYIKKIFLAQFFIWFYLNHIFLCMYSDYLININLLTVTTIRFNQLKIMNGFT